MSTRPIFWPTHICWPHPTSRPTLVELVQQKAKKQKRSKGQQGPSDPTAASPGEPRFLLEGSVRTPWGPRGRDAAEARAGEPLPSGSGPGAGRCALTRNQCSSKSAAGAAQLAGHPRTPRTPRSPLPAAPAAATAAAPWRREGRGAGERGPSAARCRRARARPGAEGPPPPGAPRPGGLRPAGVLTGSQPWGRCPGAAGARDPPGGAAGRARAGAALPSPTRGRCAPATPALPGPRRGKAALTGRDRPPSPEKRSGRVGAVSAGYV